MVKISTIIATVFSILGFLLIPTNVHASTLSEILTAMGDARRPESLNTLSFSGEQALDLSDNSSGFLPEGAELIAAWQSPDDWVCSYELSDQVYSGSGGNRAHPAVDHILFARPDYMEILNKTWTVQYQGSASWEGEPAYSLLFRPTDLTLSTPGFTMYVSKDTMIPLRTEVVFSDGTTGVTEYSWVVVDGVYVPAEFDSRLNPAVGPLNGYTTSFFNHQVNGDVSNFDFPGVEGIITSDIGDDDVDDDAPALFDELYHGFEDTPLTAEISDSDGNYDRLKFTFTLYVGDRDIFWKLDDVQDEVGGVAVDVISNWDWSGENGLGTMSGKYECGKEIMAAINDFLETDAITDFYFITFSPFKSEE